MLMAKTKLVMAKENNSKSNSRGKKETDHSKRKNREAKEKFPQQN